MWFRRYSFFSRILIPTVLFSLLFLGCGSSEPEAEDEDVSINLPGGNSLRLDKEGGEVRISGKDGEFSIKSSSEGVEYPEALNDILPLCPECTPVQVTNIGGQTAVMLKSSSSVDEVYDYYLGKAREGGYTVGMENQMQEMKMFIAEKNGSSIQCTVAEEDGTVGASIRFTAGE